MHTNRLAVLARIEVWSSGLYPSHINQGGWGGTSQPAQGQMNGLMMSSVAQYGLMASKLGLVGPHPKEPAILLYKSSPLFFHFGILPISRVRQPFLYLKERLIVEMKKRPGSRGCKPWAPALISRYMYPHASLGAFFFKVHYLRLLGSDPFAFV